MNSSQACFAKAKNDYSRVGWYMSGLDNVLVVFSLKLMRDESRTKFFVFVCGDKHSSWSTLRKKKWKNGSNGKKMQLGTESASQWVRSVRLGVVGAYRSVLSRHGLGC